MWSAISRRFMDAVNGKAPPPEDIGDASKMTAIGWAADDPTHTGKPANVMQFDV
jgi:hypothetical protein